MLTKKSVINQSILPVIEKIDIENTDPTVIYKKLALKNQYSFILENLLINEKKYSLIGITPLKVVKLNYIAKKKTRLNLIERGKSFLDENTDYITFLKEQLESIHYESIPNIPDFFASFVGYFGYEIISIWEDIYHNEIDRDLKHGELPLSILVSPRISLILDQSEKVGYLVNIVETRSEEGIESKISSAKNENKQILKDLEKTSTQNETERNANQIRLKIKNHTSKEEFIKKVEKTKNYINAGEAFQVVLSQRFSCKITQHPFEIYENLRRINPSPYMFYLNFPEVTILGSSPEMLVKVEGERVITRPLAGTRKRGETTQVDEIIEKELLDDDKERAEHIMLVDLARNDLGRVCKEGSVKVTKFFGIEKYSHVMHIYSQVEGLKKDYLNSLDVLKSLFPAGTVSGAPKIRAIEIIDELEDEPREIYAGVVGYIDTKGNLDTSIAIRTMVCKENEVRIQAGAGIVSYSIGENEYYETVNKAMAMFKSLEKGDF
ncbi:MAG TPA: anthranilate synthase component I [Petrotoga sp.]|nr:MAG: Anthranilate synthase [Petrotoga mobilis]HBT51474.1 anthranilate synthase component I [Petrotoga sp.]